MSEKCCYLRVCFIGLLHAIYRDRAEKPASSHQVTRMQKVSARKREGEMDRHIETETHIQAQKVFPKPLSIDRVQTSKSLVSGENSF